MYTKIALLLIALYKNSKFLFKYLQIIDYIKNKEETFVHIHN